MLSKGFARLVYFSADLGAFAIDAKTAKIKGLAHREGQTRSLQIAVMTRLSIRHKSLTLYPIELGGRLGINQIRITRPCRSPHCGLGALPPKVRSGRATSKDSAHLRLRLLIEENNETHLSESKSPVYYRHDAYGW